MANGTADPWEGRYPARRSDRGPGEREAALKLRPIYVILTLWLAVLAGAAACSPVPATDDPLAADERTWAEMEVSDYHIEVMVVESIWHAQTYALVVRDGAVVESASTCIPAPMEFGECTVRDFDPADFTVPGLFARARQALAGQGAAWVTVNFDPQYGFPSRISFDNPDAVDEDWSWRVTGFGVP